MLVWILDSDVKISVDIATALTEAGIPNYVLSRPEDVTPLPKDVVLVNADSIPSYQWGQFSDFWEIAHTENQADTRAYFHRPFNIQDLVRVIEFLKPSNLNRYPLYCTYCGTSVRISDVQIVPHCGQGRRRCPTCRLPGLADSTTEYGKREYREAS